MIFNNTKHHITQQKYYKNNKKNPKQTMLQPGKLTLEKQQPQGLNQHLNLSASKPMIESTKQQQFTMRDDVIQFSHDIVNSARSQFHFRRRNSVHTAQQGSHGFSREIKKMIKKQNEKFKEVSFELENGKDSKDDKDGKSGRYKKREIFTSDHSGSSSRHKLGGSFKISKTQSMQMDKINKIMPANITNSVLQKPINSSQQIVSAKKPQASSQIPKLSAPLFKSFNSPVTPSSNLNHSVSSNPTNYLNLQRKHNKSVLTDSSVQGWLNQALIQASPNIVVDKNENNAGLKVYNIDRSSLIKLGLHQDHVNRLYRSLFVYSLGFNNLLAECCGPNNKMLRNNIWKAFAVLLQYCSGGNFSTTIGQIQRDKQQKLSILRSQIQKRQKQLQQQDQQSQKKNMKILKEYRQLQKQVKQLQQQRDVILQQFHQAEQAFNQQIALRLKYQTRINQIHGVYEELSQKYKLTKEQLEKDKGQIQGLKGVVEGLRGDIGRLNVELSLSIQQNIQLKTQLAHLSQANHTLTQKNTLTTSSLLTAKSQTESHVQSLSSQSRAVQNLTLSLQNQKSTSQSLFKTLQSKSEQFEKAMKQNAQLHQHINRDTQQINSLLEELRNVRGKHVELQAMILIYQRKNREWEEKVGELRGRVGELEEGMKKKEIQIKLEIQKRESVEKDIQKCYQSIKQMKATQNTLRQQLQQSQNMVCLLQNQIASQKERIQKLIVEIQGYKTKIHQLRVQLTQKQSTITMLTEQLKSTNQQWQIKTQNLQSQLTTQTNKTETYKIQTNTLQTQLQQLTQISQKTYSQLKNQRFQRNNLELYYKQSLTVMEEQIAHIKQLSIQISEITQALENAKRKYSSLELVHQKKVQMLERDVLLWKSQAEVQGRLFKDMVGFVHPMIKEDLEAEVNRLMEKIADRQYKLKQSTKKQKQLQTAKFTLQQQLKKTHTKTTQQLQNIFNNQIQKQSQQISYLQQKISYQSQKLQQIQSQLQKSNEQRKTYYHHSRSMQAEFMDKINEKNKQLGLINQKYRQLLNQYEESLKVSNCHGRHVGGHVGGKNDEDKELREKIAKLEMELKIHMDRQKQREKQKHGKNDHSPSPQKKGDKKNGKQSHYNDHKRKNEKQDSQQTEQQKRLRQESNDNESQGQKLKSKQQRNNGEQNMQVDVDASKTGVESFKKREQMRKKIKGAYLYYLK